MFKLFKNVLYYPGCMSKFAFPELQKNYEKILKKCGIDFIKLEELEVCCGSPVLNAGYFKSFEILTKKNSSLFKDHAVKKIITSCPACFKTFKLEYPKFLEKFDIEVEHITQTIWKAIESEKLKLSKKSGKATYHDPCHLGRYCGIYEEPRKIITALGFDLVEMEFNKENSWCCGAGGGVVGNYPELAEVVSLDRINQAKKTKTEILVTTCPLCYIHFKRTVEKNDLKLKVYELSELI